MRKKINKNTISFSENKIKDEQNKLNVTFYPKSNLIHIENSNAISNKYEQEAIIAEIMESDTDIR